MLTSLKDTPVASTTSSNFMSSDELDAISAMLDAGSKTSAQADVVTVRPRAVKRAKRSKKSARSRVVAQSSLPSVAKRAAASRSFRISLPASTVKRLSSRVVDISKSCSSLLSRGVISSAEFTQAPMVLTLDAVAVSQLSTIAAAHKISLLAAVRRCVLFLDTLLS